MPVPPTLSLTEAQIFTALRGFLTGILPAGTNVIKAQVNRVAEPAGADFVLMTPLMQERLSTNDVTFQDNVLTGAVTGTTLTVSEITQQESPLAPGMTLIDSGYPAMNLAIDTVIVEQISGTPPGGIGTYAVSPSQTVAQETMYAGVRSDFVPTKMTVQLDVHGPNGGNNIKVIDSLFRSEYGTTAFAESGIDVMPLYCGDARQMPFINDQQQYEDRWTMDAVMQFNPIVGTPQQFADQVVVHTVEAATQYTGP